MVSRALNCLGDCITSGYHSVLERIHSKSDFHPNSGSHGSRWDQGQLSTETIKAWFSDQTKDLRCCVKWREKKRRRKQPCCVTYSSQNEVNLSAELHLDWVDYSYLWDLQKKITVKTIFKSAVDFCRLYKMIFLKKRSYDLFWVFEATIRKSEQGCRFVGKNTWPHDF